MEQAEVVEVENVPLANYPRIEEVLYNWTHQINLDFYNNLDLKCFKQFCQIGGLVHNADIDALAPNIKSSTRILEVGFGYGRAIKGILNLGYKGHVTAIDSSSYFVDCCRSNFKSYNINFAHTDLLNFEPKQHYDLVLLLWSTLSIFSPCEYDDLFAKLESLLAPSGLVAIDLYHGVRSLQTLNCDDLLYTTEYKGHSYIAYIPTIEGIGQLANCHGLSERQIISYQANNIDRTILLIGN